MHKDGMDDNLLKVNHKTEACHSLKSSVNMTIVEETSVSDGISILDVSSHIPLLTPDFYIDSGANAVLINKFYRHLLRQPKPDNSHIDGISGETTMLTTERGNIVFMDTIIPCKYSANCPKSVLGVSVLTPLGFIFIFVDNFVIIVNKKTKTKYKAIWSRDKLYKLNTTSSILFEQVPLTIATLASVRPINQYDLWHARLGHVHSTMIERMSKNPIYTDRGLKITDKSFESKEKDLCSTCAAG
jgi:hypothetical protein